MKEKKEKKGGREGNNEEEREERKKRRINMDVREERRLIWKDKETQTWKMESKLSNSENFPLAQLETTVHYCCNRLPKLGSSSGPGTCH